MGVYSFTTGYGYRGFRTLTMRYFYYFPSVLVVYRGFYLFVQGLRGVRVKGRTSRVLFHYLFVQPREYAMVKVMEGRTTLIFYSFCHVGHNVSYELVHRKRKSGVGGVNVVRRVRVRFFLLSLHVHSQFSYGERDPLSDLTSFRGDRYDGVVFIRRRALNVRIFFLGGEFRRLSIRVFSYFASGYDVDSRSTNYGYGVNEYATQVSNVRRLSVLVSVLEYGVSRSLAGNYSVVSKSFRDVSYIRGGILVGRLGGSLLTFFLVVYVCVGLSLIGLERAWSAGRELHVCGVATVAWFCVVKSKFYGACRLSYVLRYTWGCFCCRFYLLSCTGCLRGPFSWP